ncbi:SpoIIE family protein phosphatase [Clostridium formicaceticum]|uniref:Stage 0 sporulation protein A homolog n=1 Tax=Clostridium formicaceticum TaxID=1497 RepID=A0AAC9RIZ3_9CLOT|nr:SpoIIE family protein phosphatase [Clostridium formicaceticum]AOY76062.1 histidine kinase [Clostridium formicaceticum]ARE86424.1 Phosphoserine phosphatase RsbP [Clostridium formicaceticum]
MSLGKALIIHTKKDNRCDIKKILRRHGHEVIEEEISSNTILQVLNLMPHIILIDMDGEESVYLELCQRLKKEERSCHIPLIAVWGEEDSSKKFQWIEFGIDDYIQKPFDERELMLRVKNSLKLAKLQQNYSKTKKALKESLITINKQKIELENNLNMASKIQEALIPKSLGNIPNCSFFWQFQPSGKVGGDIFDVFMLDEDHMGLYAIDVMGHGVASSMLAVALSEFLILDVDRGSPLKKKISRSPYYEIISPLEVINYLNKRFPFTKYNHYFTIFYMVLNVKTGVLKYVRAAHPSPILIRDNGDIMELDGYGTPVGFEFTEGYEEKTVYLESGDHLIIYTDGLLELKTETGTALEYDGLVEYLEKEIQSSYHNHYLTYNLNKLAKTQEKLKDDLSVLEMKWVKFL